MTGETAPLSFKQKVFRLQSSIRGITKDKENPHFHYKYISAQNVNETVKDTLAELGLIAQVNTKLESIASVSSKDKAGRDVNNFVAITKTTITLLDVDSEEFMEFSAVGSGTDTSDKHVMKATTASSKYATIAVIFGASKDDPEAVTNPSDVTEVEKPASVRSNRSAFTAKEASLLAEAGIPSRKAETPPAGSAAAAQGPQELDGGMFAITVGVDNVYKGRPSKTKPGKFGPGTVLGTNGERYDTFDTGLLEIAKRAKEEGKNVNIVYSYDEQWKKNTIAEHGLGIFGEVMDAPALDPTPEEEATY